MPMPSARSWRMMPNSCSDSPAVSDDVGSSMMMMRAFSDSALAISTICICPAVSVETGVVGGSFKPTRSSSSARRRVHRDRVAAGPRDRRGASSLPRKMLAAMSRFGASISSWWISAMPSRLASRTP